MGPENSETSTFDRPMDNEWAESVKLCPFWCTPCNSHVKPSTVYDKQRSREVREDTATSRGIGSYTLLSLFFSPHPHAPIPLGFGNTRTSKPLHLWFAVANVHLQLRHFSHGIELRGYHVNININDLWFSSESVGLIGGSG